MTDLEADKAKLCEMFHTLRKHFKERTSPKAMKEYPLENAKVLTTTGSVAIRDLTEEHILIAFPDPLAEAPGYRVPVSVDQYIQSVFTANRIPIKP
jgi:hypothetical protein